MLGTGFIPASGIKIKIIIKCCLKGFDDSPKCEIVKFNLFSLSKCTIVYPDRLAIMHIESTPKKFTTLFGIEIKVWRNTMGPEWHSS
jgi:hypothetical protein